MLFNLKDGYIEDIKTNVCFTRGGCPTCNIGAVSVDKVEIVLNEITITVTTIRYDTESFDLHDRYSYNYGYGDENLTIDDIIRLFDIKADETTVSDFVTRVVTEIGEISRNYKVEIKTRTYDEEDGNIESW
jgi:hypothetical protein